MAVSSPHAKPAEMAETQGTDCIPGQAGNGGHRQETGDIALLRLLRTRSSLGTQARLQPQPYRRLPSPGVLAIRSASRHRMPQPLQVAFGERLVDALQPLLIADRLFALPQQRIAAPLNPVRPDHFQSSARDTNSARNALRST